MKRVHQDEHVERIKRRCIERLSIKRKLPTQMDNPPQKRKCEYHRGFDDGKNISEEKWYSFFKDSYNTTLKEEIEKAISEIKSFYESRIHDMGMQSHNTQWVF